MSTVIFDGPGEMPELNRITAKKNYASSSQSHKMGATAMFNDILHYLAQEKYPDLLNEVEGKVAVRQHPVYGFQKELKFGTTDQYTYRFIGLFTVGPDKGDKGYFNFTNSSVKDVAIRLEGTDHLKGVGFNYPWVVNGVNRIRYSDSSSSLCIITGADVSNWTAILEQSLCGTAKTESDIHNYLESKFKPAYECAYNNNPLILGLDKTQISLDQINSDIELFNTYRYSCEEDSNYKNILNHRQYSYFEFWFDGEYDLYYLDKETNQYQKNGINLQRDLNISDEELVGKTINQKNELFISKRIARFKEEAPKYFNIDDSLYQLAILYIICASDNGEKNMYPYYLGKLWRFLQDDLDSIFSTDNQGQDTKPYSSELHDFTDDTKNAYIYKGEDSAFWLLIELAFENRLNTMCRDILQAMYDMSTKGTTTPDKLIGFFDDYFFDRVNDCFTKSAYNNDTEYSYEEAWNNKNYVQGVDIHPLAQALGNHESTERAWLEKRIVYLMSKYGFGGYSSYEDKALGTISLRTQVKVGFTLTPAIDMYPTILGGQAEKSVAPKRIKAGESVQLNPLGGGNTNVYIVGTDWLTDIGDLKDLQLDPSANVELSVGSKRLRRLKVGDEHSATSGLTTLTISQCDSLEEVDARNLRYLTKNIDLSKCPRLINAFFKGTNITGVTLADGSKIEYLQLPGSITKLDLQNTKFLNTLDIESYDNIGTLRLDNVPIINGFEVLKEIYNTEGQKLKDIRLVGFNYTGDSNDIQMLFNLSNDIDKDGNSHNYNGIDNSGTPTSGNPVIEGILNVENTYQDIVDEVQTKYPGLTLNVFGDIYIRFNDEAFQELVAVKYGDSIGVTQEKLNQKTSIDIQAFRNNQDITDLSDLYKFKNLTTIGIWAFAECSNLERVYLPDTITSTSSHVFGGCKKLTDLVLSDNLTTIAESIFTNIGIDSLVIPDKVETLNTFSFGCSLGRGRETITRVVLGKALKSLHSQSFYRQYKLKDIYISTLKQWLNLDTLMAFYESNSKTLYLGTIEKITEDKGEYGVVTVGYNWDKLEGTGDYVGQETRTLVTTGMVNEALQDESITEIRQYTFNNMTQLEGTLIIPNNIESLKGYAFYNCTNLVEVVILNGLKSISGNDVFHGCSSLESITIPDSVTFIDNNAFNQCPALKMVHISDIATWCKMTFKSYRSNPLSYAKNLYLNGELVTSIAVPESMTEIKPYTFYNCTSLASITIPNSVTTIGNEAFNYCESLESVTIPNSVTTIGNEAFSGCTLENFTIEDTSKINMSSIGNTVIKNLYVNDLKPLYKFSFRNNNAANKNTNIHVNGELVKNVFIDYLGVNAVTFLFQGSTITSAKIAEGYTHADGGPFEQCQQIQWVDFPSTIKSIGWVRYMKAGVNLIVRAVIPPSTSVFFGTYGNIYVPDESVEAYKNATGWIAYEDIIEPLSKIEGLNLLPASGTVVKVTILKTTYDGIEVTPEYTIEGTAATLDGNILTFNEFGEVIVTATYNGENVSRTYSWNGKFEFTNWEYNTAYNTALNIGDTFTKAYVTSGTEGWKCGIIVLDGVSSVVINGQGGIKPRLYCFVDTNNKVLQVATELYQAYNESIDVPQGARYLIVNINKNTAETGSLILK